MPRFCVAHGCTNRSDKAQCRQNNISFHKFPLNDPIRIKLWLLELKRVNFKPNKHSVLCSEHFNDEDFDTSHPKRRRTLKAGVVPSKFSFTKLSGKRKVTSFQFKLPETIVVDRIHIENQSGAIVEEIASQDGKKEAIITHDIQEIEKEVIVEHDNEKEQSEFITGHHDLEESTSEDPTGNDILQDGSESCSSVTNIHFQALSRDLSKLLNDSSTSDVLFSCDGKTFPAHKIILKIRSSVFSAIFQSQMVKDQSVLIKVEGVKSSIFQGFLKYLYTGKVPRMSQESAKQFYDIGLRYAVKELQKASSDFLAKNISEITACETLLFAVQNSDEDFRKNVIACIVDKKIPECDSGWPEFCKNHPVLANEVMLLYIQKNRSNPVP